MLLAGTWRGWMNEMRRRLISLAALIGLMGASTAQAGQAVDLELMLAVDASTSVDDEEFKLQTRGLSEAFRDPAVHAAIRAAGDNGIAVAVMQWSEFVNQTITRNWTVIRDEAGALALADDIDAVGRMISGGGTAIYGAINSSLHALNGNGFDGRRRVIDISGDGRSDLLIPTLTARDRAVAQGITINGLAVLNNEPTLDEYYRDKVIGGAGAFVITAADYQAFATAILTKLIREIAAAPIAAVPAPTPRPLRRPAHAVNSSPYPPGLRNSKENRSVLPLTVLRPTS